MKARVVHLYWNHICILHNFEKRFLSEACERLAQRGIELRVTFFGMGYPHHMSSYLRQDDAVAPDIVVSADLEVFENARIAEKLGACHPCASWAPLKDTAAVRASLRGERLLPFVIIPMTAYGKVSCCETTFPEAIRRMRVAFGGVDNSAAKTVVKAVWQRYGEAAARDALERCLVADMPIQAFQAARQGVADVSVAPSLYGLRADGIDRIQSVFAEGPLLLPTYFCARESIDEQTARIVCEEVMAQELIDFYTRNGDLIACSAKARFESSQERADRVWAVDADFALGLGRRFYELYCGGIPGAQDLS